MLMSELGFIAYSTILTGEGEKGEFPSIEPGTRVVSSWSNGTYGGSTPSCNSDGVVTIVVRLLILTENGADSRYVRPAAGARVGNSAERAGATRARNHRHSDAARGDRRKVASHAN